ncbi:MAG: Plug domain-containing protein [Bacteroidaceae bacterium]|nr:Plug domain-containing protein [Bacteroidaceae bacterium]
MKTEDIDKRIGMPDVDKEWARFEQEVIGKETKRHSALAWALGIGIAASVALLLIYNIGKTQTEQPLVAQVQPAQPELVSKPARVPAKEVVAEVSKPVATPRKEPALAKADAPATTGLDIPAREYTGAVQKREDIEDLAFESVDQALQEIASADLSSGTTMRLRGLGDSVIDQIGKTDSFLVVVNGKTLFDSRGLTSEEIDRRIEEYLKEQGLLQDIKIPCNNGAIVIMASTPEKREELQRMIANLTIVPKLPHLGSGTLRLIGTGSRPSDKDRIDSTLILVNGEPLPEHLKQEVLGNNPDDLDTHMPRYFSQQGLMIDSVYVHKDSEFTTKYGGRAKYGVIEITTVPDTYSDAYVCKHPKLKKKYQRVEGYVFDNNGKPLTEAWVHVKRERAVLKKHPELDLAGAATDSTGHYVLWLPKDADIMLCAEQAGYKSFEFSPSDKDIVTHHLEKTYNMRLRGNQEPTPELQGVIAGLPDAPPNDSILYIVNGVPQPKENNKWLGKMSYLDYFKRQHLLVDSVKRNMNEEAKQRYLERFGMAAKHGVVEYFCVEDTLCDYYMNQHEELKASRRRVSGVVLDENDEPLDHTIIHILQFEPEKKIWGVETTDSLGNFAFWVPRTGVKMNFKYIGYKAVVVEPSDTFQTIYLLPNDNLKSLKESLKF